MCVGVRGVRGFRGSHPVSEEQKELLVIIALVSVLQQKTPPLVINNDRSLSLMYTARIQREELNKAVDSKNRKLLIELIIFSSLPFLDSF